MAEIDPELTALFLRFEKDIVYDAHQTLTSFRRSDARKEIQSRGPGIVPVIALYLDSIKDRKEFGGYDSNSELACMWLWLISDLRKDIKLPRDGEGLTIAELADILFKPA